MKRILSSLLLLLPLFAQAQERIVCDNLEYRIIDYNGDLPKAEVSGINYIPEEFEMDFRAFGDYLLLNFRKLKFLQSKRAELERKV